MLFRGQLLVEACATAVCTRLAFRLAHGGTIAVGARMTRLALTPARRSFRHYHVVVISNMLRSK